MCKKLVASFMVVLVSVNSGLAKDASLVGRWTLQEGSGTVARDITSNGHDGKILGASWVSPGFDGQKPCLEFSFCSCVEVSDAPELNFGPSDSYTFCAWVNMAKLPSSSDPWAGILSKGREALTNYYCAVLAAGTGQLVFGHSGNNLTGNPLKVGEWTHMACVYDAGLKRIVINGKEDVQTTSAQTGSTPGTPFCIGKNNAFSECAACKMSDVRLYSRALTDDEIVDIMPGGVETPEVAGNVLPAERAKDVPVDTPLAWTPGEFAKAHDVYLGTDFNDVNQASRTGPLGVLVSRGQDANTYDPVGVLAFGRTYYWRVDEVNAPPTDSMVFKGAVWSFATEPYGYLVKPIKATASSVMVSTMGPEKTIDGSGLNASDHHSTSSSQMWTSKKGQSPAWIQYEFDKVYVLHEMWVWNSNQTVELSAGIGAKDVTVETSIDGSTWVKLAGVPQFNQATGDPSYIHNTTVEFGAVQAKFVKLTVTRNYNTKGVQQYGLSEVRFFYVPVRAFGPAPATGAAGVPVNATLSWRPGRLAAKHEVYLSRDPNAVVNGAALVKTVTDHSLGLGSLSLDYGKTYTWKINEVNDAATPKSWEGDVWSFTTIGYAVIDDFESYNDACNRVFFSWVDGFGYSASPACGVAASTGNGTGSTVGNTNPPFAEKVTVHGGKQSMPMAFDNTKSPFYSETQHEWATPQTWTGGGVNNLVVYLQGRAAAFMEISPGTIVMNGTGTDIWNNGDQFRLVYKLLKGNGSIVAKVASVGNTDGWAKAGVMIRESLDSGSVHAMNVVSAANGVSFQRRAATGDVSTGDTVTPIHLAPYWVKLTRTGNTFTAQHSADGVAWVDIVSAAPVTITMANDVFVGLAVTSHSAGAVCGAKFSNVSTTGSVSGAWQVAEVGEAQANGNMPETFYVAVQDSAGKTKVVTHPDATVIATGAWESWSIPLSQFSSAGVNLGSVKKMIVGVGDRNAPKAGGAGRLCIDDIRLEP